MFEGPETKIYWSIEIWIQLIFLGHLRCVLADAVDAEMEDEAWRKQDKVAGREVPFLRVVPFRWHSYSHGSAIVSHGRGSYHPADKQASTTSDSACF